MCLCVRLRAGWLPAIESGISIERPMKARTYNVSSSLVRPELVEIKNTIRNLRKDAEMRLTLDIEAQQSFEFLSGQVHGLRKAFATLSDVLVEEVDLIRSETVERHDELTGKIADQAKGCKKCKTDESKAAWRLRVGDGMEAHP